MKFEVEHNPFRTSMLFVGPLLAALVGMVLHFAGHHAPISWMAAITVLCAAWWITEPIPIPATSLIPLALLPLTGVLDRAAVANAYGNYLILLLMGGFMLSRAMEKSGTHEKLALVIMRVVGAHSPRRLIFGMMVATALISMWVSNTATTLAMLPVALAILKVLKDERVAVPMLLGLAFAANIGGIGTPIGTPPNLVFMGAFDELIADGENPTLTPWTFTRWMMIGVPVVLVLIPVLWLWLTRGLSGGSGVELPAPTRWTTAQRRVLIVFLVTAGLWIFRSNPGGGWAGWLGAEPKQIGDSTIAALMVVVMFLIPDGDRSRLLDWKSASSIPWGILLLFGGGIALARGFVSSGLSDLIAAQLIGITQIPVVLMILTICLLVTFLTEVTSNTAITVLLMPILASVALAADMDPARLMIPAAMSASCAFMMPVATAPNAVVYSTGQIPMRRMNLEGVFLNLTGAVVITAICSLAL
ncbi:MAG: SLC13 family permease [Planctomycetota bacterium]|nr:SLC13 family permease [Planctomycetota bacterium]